MTPSWEAFLAQGPIGVSARPDGAVEPGLSGSLPLRHVEAIETQRIGHRVCEILAKEGAPKPIAETLVREGLRTVGVSIDPAVDLWWTDVKVVPEREEAKNSPSWLSALGRGGAPRRFQVDVPTEVAWWILVVERAVAENERTRDAYYKVAIGSISAAMSKRRGTALSPDECRRVRRSLLRPARPFRSLARTLCSMESGMSRNQVLRRDITPT